MRLILLILLLFPATAHAEGEAPFGLHMGMKISDLQIRVSKEDGVYILQSVPEPDAKFQQYRVILTGETGVCMVMASGGDVLSTGEGRELKAAFHDVVDDYSQLYGTPMKQVGIQYNSNWWKRDDRFMLALSEKKANMVSMWDQKRNVKVRGSDFTQIIVQGFAPNRYRGNVNVLYKFTNYPDCKKILNDKKQVKE